METSIVATMFDNHTPCKSNICFATNQRRKIKTATSTTFKIILQITKIAIPLHQISNKGCLKTWAEIIPKNLIRVMPA